MLTTNPNLQRGAKRGGTEKFTGVDRAVMLSSLARGRGFKFSPKFGVVDPNKGDEVVADQWDKIAVILLGKGATEQDTHTVEQMLAKIKNDPNYEELIAGIKTSFEKQGRMFPESAKGIQHGMRLAEKNIIGKTADKIGGAFKTAKAGFKAGYATSAAGKGGNPIDVYKKAGGGKTTVGQAGDVAKTVGNKITGNNVTLVKGYGTPQQRTQKIAANRKDKIAQLTKNYNPDELIGKQVAAVINFPPMQIGKMISEILVLGFPDDNNEPILVLPSKKVANGGKLF